MLNRNYNPDVLTCLANLSSDEVFTPPKMANALLDQLPEELWGDKNARFLDPVCKSGVFLREIAKRLDAGLKGEIVNRQERINHIFSKQLYGLAITELTSLLSRRSLYCSKKADGKYSVCESFDDSQGHIRFERIEHSWDKGHCLFCGANQANYERSEELETHAYQFIHGHSSEEILNMKFDVIIGNPPYQLSDGGYGTSAKPIYHLFVQQAKKLTPRYLSMIIPARWFSGGKGLDEFRAEMLGDERIREIHDFPDASDVFPGVQIKGGVCYFLWKRDEKGLCRVVSYSRDGNNSEMERPLLEEKAATFIRYNKAIPILKKVRAMGESSIKSKISSSKPFGLRTFFKGKKKPFKGSILLYQNGGIGYVTRGEIPKNENWINSIKVLVPPLGSGSDSFPHPILGMPFVVKAGSACTETYLVAGIFKTEREAQNMVSYMKTRLFRFLVLLNKPAQHATAKVYEFVPIQSFDKSWTDEELYQKYGINTEEIAYIESMIRPMEAANG